MGHMTNHLIVVSTFDLKKLEDLRIAAFEIFKDTDMTKFSRMVGGIVVTPVNVDYTLIIYPDGSKEGWEDSDLGDSYRSQFIELINSLKYDDDSNSLRYAELYYADDEKTSGVSSHN